MTAQHSKHARVFAALGREIRDGHWQPGERLPSEAELTKRFGVSRITVSRAMRDLKAAGLIQRRAGSGSFANYWRDGQHRLSFGLLIPDLGESEIFEPICHGMMASPQAGRHALLWGNSSGQSRRVGDAKEEGAWQLCRQYIERKVSGVFFAPLEHTPHKDQINLRISRALDRAGIPVVMLDRPVLPFPEPLHHDLVGIDNKTAGRMVTEHLLQLGCQRVNFIAASGAAATVDDREAGFREALYANDMTIDKAYMHRIEPDDDASIKSIIAEQRPDGIVCANDRTAGRVMHALRRLGFEIPHEVRLVGIDDVEYASLLPVPLTTLRQPVRRIGETALAVMLDRLERPDSPARDIRLPCEITIRESCGSQARQAA